jgi:Raf kinase inhibitor-like YbhB/YbcL family protein
MVIVVLVLSLYVDLGCTGKDEKIQSKGETTMRIELTSKAFRNGENIPKQFTGDDKDISPPLQWTDSPEGTKSLALICDDPDAPRGTWVHWVIFNLPAAARELEQGVATKDVLDNGARQGKNDFGKIGYGGPAPPPGKAHRYFFKLYALDTTLDLAAGVTKEQVVAGMKGHALAEGQLMGRYQR